MNSNYSFSSSLGPVIDRYLTLKQALGRQYSAESRILQHLDAFLYNTQRDLTLESFSKWCTTLQHLSSTVRRNWMRVTRNLCLYRRRTEPECFVPDSSQFPGNHQPVQPHIFTDSEILRLLNAATQLTPGSSSVLRLEIFRLALVLLYTTGLRRGELLRLTISDYCPRENTLLIRESKFHKSRLLPLSNDGWHELESYLKARRRNRLSTSAITPLLNHYNGMGSYTETGLNETFRTLFRMAEIKTVAGKLPRIHDFRHTFAVQALLRWYNEGADVQAKLPMLSLYMGHVSIVSTQYYLRFIDEILNSASQRFEQSCACLFERMNKGGAL